MTSRSFLYILSLLQSFWAFLLSYFQPKPDVTSPTPTEVPGPQRYGPNRMTPISQVEASNVGPVPDVPVGPRRVRFANSAADRAPSSRWSADKEEFLRSGTSFRSTRIREEDIRTYRNGGSPKRFSTVRLQDSEAEKRKRRQGGLHTPVRAPPEICVEDWSSQKFNMSEMYASASSLMPPPPVLMKSSTSPASCPSSPASGSGSGSPESSLVVATISPTRIPKPRPVALRPTPMFTSSVISVIPATFAAPRPRVSYQNSCILAGILSHLPASPPRTEDLESGIVPAQEHSPPEASHMSQVSLRVSLTFPINLSMPAYNFSNPLSAVSGFLWDTTAGTNLLPVHTMPLPSSTNTAFIASTPPPKRKTHSRVRGSVTGSPEILYRRRSCVPYLDVFDFSEYYEDGSLDSDHSADSAFDDFVFVNADKDRRSILAAAPIGISKENHVPFIFGFPSALGGSLESPEGKEQRTKELYRNSAYSRCLTPSHVSNMASVDLGSPASPQQSIPLPSPRKRLSMRSPGGVNALPRLNPKQASAHTNKDWATNIVSSFAEETDCANIDPDMSIDSTLDERLRGVCEDLEVFHWSQDEFLKMLAQAAV